MGPGRTILDMRKIKHESIWHSFFPNQVKITWSSIHCLITPDVSRAWFPGNVFDNETTQEIAEGAFLIAPRTDFFMLKNLGKTRQDTWVEHHGTNASSQNSESLIVSKKQFFLSSLKANMFALDGLQPLEQDLWHLPYETCMFMPKPWWCKTMPTSCKTWWWTLCPGWHLNSHLIATYHSCNRCSHSCCTLQETYASILDCAHLPRWLSCK